MAVTFEKFVESGDVYQSNDPRDKERRVKVVEMDMPYVIIKNIKTGRRTRVFVTQFHTDGKKRRTGYSFVGPAR